MPLLKKKTSKNLYLLQSKKKINYILGSVFSVIIILNLETKKTTTEIRIKHHRVKLEFGLNFLIK